MTVRRTRNRAAGRTRRLLVVGAGWLVCVAVLHLVTGIALATWWAGVVSGVVDHRFGAATLLGLFVGAGCTLAPLVALRLAARRGVTWPVRWPLVGFAAVVALPNLITLGVALHAGRDTELADRLLDVAAPSFQTASLIGAAVALLVFSALVTLFGSSRPPAGHRR